jgi:predicted ATP-dependent endonuclease of OLD family
MTIELERYRRFESPTSIDVSGDVVALVGPNEAGKTSILEAMLSFDRREAFTARERTRNTVGNTRVRAGYVLDDDDRTAIEDIPGGAKVRWWTLEKADDGGYFFNLHPAPSRDLQPRHERAASLRAFAEKEAINRFISIKNVTIADAYEEALSALSSAADSLTDDQVEAIQGFGDAMLAFPAVCEEPTPDSANQHISADFCALLEELSEYDEGLSPHVEAGRRLVMRRPSFVMFRAEDRDLRTTYDLRETINDLPAALDNLAQLARLDLRSLLDAVTNGNRGLREQLVERANAELRDVFKRSWRQSDITVRLGLQGIVVEVLVSLPGGGYTEIEERSAGLLSFIALRAFLAKYDFAVPPILLVDEAETHLHYDAQADLINLFTEQRLTAKVIYSTHSAGCLPRDLGNGIRVVFPSSESERSTVKNSVWQGREGGFTPLIYGMGATTFAFLPARHVLLGEGPTDAMLYPTLFREATGQRALDFQVAPGLAVVGPAGMIRLASEGGSVIYITDGDDQGRMHRQSLISAGVPAKRIFCLDEVFGEPIVLEDLIDLGSYTSAVNELLQDFQDPQVLVEPSDLPPVARTLALDAWCQIHGLKPPDKADVAQRLLDKKSNEARRGDELTLLAQLRRKRLARLYLDINSGFTPAMKGRRKR